jgi:hypothetical protein
MVRLQQDREAWEAGFAAGAAGGRARCPYPPGTVGRWSWEAGYAEGKAPRRNAARKSEADEDNRITQAREILGAAYVPAATRGALAEAIGRALDILDADGGDASAA